MLTEHTWALFGVPDSRSIYLDPLHFPNAEGLFRRLSYGQNSIPSDGVLINL
jgi:hypothetical protein